MEEHGGAIAISSSPGVGTTVTLTVPATLPQTPPITG